MQYNKYLCLFIVMLATRWQRFLWLDRDYNTFVDNVVDVLLVLARLTYSSLTGIY